MGATVGDFEQFAAMRGAGRAGYGDAGLHRSSARMSPRTWARMVDAQGALDSALTERRAALRIEYARLVDAGELSPMSPGDKLRETAAGDPANESVQAARRILAARAERMKRDA